MRRFYGPFRKPGHLAAVLFLVLPAVSGWSRPVSGSESLETLQSRLDAARLERMRWERVIATQADLVQHPDKLSSASRDAAEELRSQGRSFAVEGLTMGLSSACDLGVASLPGKEWRTKEKLKDVAATIEATHKLLLEDQLRGAKEPKATDSGIEKAGAALKLLARTASHKEDRETMAALASIGTPGLELLGRLMRGDKLTWEKDGPLAKDIAQGVRATMLAYIQHRHPDELIDLGKRLAKIFPRIGEFTEAVGPKVMSEGLGWAGLINGAAQASLGGYVWYEGVGLDHLADDINNNQEHAAEMLTALLPHARQARDSALRREARLSRIVEALKKQNPPTPSRSVPPSARVLDDGAGVPANVYSGLTTTQAVLQSSPQLTYHLTKNEIRRREAIAAAEHAAAVARERAAQQARERQQRWEREREQAQRERSQPRGFSSGGPDRSSGRVDLSGVQERIQGVINNVLSGW